MDQCTITVTRSCNLRCGFCYAQKTGYRREDVLQFEDFKRIIDFCSEEKIRNIVFTGGEPTLYPKLLDALKYIKAKGNSMIPAMATNGIELCDNDFCRSIVESGLEYVDISLKGKDGIDCRDATGRDCYEQQMTAIKNISQTGIEFTCSIILTRLNIDSYCNLVRSACQKGARQISFTFEIDNLSSSERDENYLREHNPFALIESFMSSIEELNSITKDWWIEYSFPLCVYTEEQMVQLAGKFACPCQVHKGNGITFDTKLNAIPCNMYFDLVIGKLGKDFSSLSSYQDVVERSLKLEKAILKTKAMPSPNCTRCIHFENCQGGCPVTWKNYSYDALMKFKSKYYGGR